VNPWKERAAWPFIWLAAKLAPVMRRLSDAVDRWLDR
jgi:hypothetical protein